MGGSRGMGGGMTFASGIEVSERPLYAGPRGLPHGRGSFLYCSDPFLSLFAARVSPTSLLHVTTLNKWFHLSRLQFLHQEN